MSTYPELKDMHLLVEVIRRLRDPGNGRFPKAVTLTDLAKNWKLFNSGHTLNKLLLSAIEDGTLLYVIDSSGEPTYRDKIKNRTRPVKLAHDESLCSSYMRYGRVHGEANTICYFGSGRFYVIEDVLPDYLDKVMQEDPIEIS